MTITHKITQVKLLKERLKHARRLRGLTQADLAAMIPCSQSTVGQAERGRSETLRDVTAFARALRVPADWLAEGKGPTPTAGGAPPADHPTRIGAGRRSSDHQAWPFTLSREDFDRLLLPEQIATVDALISTLAYQSPRRHGNRA